ncbi:MAG: DUF4974 domain-containing protein [Tannerella sp.]|jgi:ferric-dicitrate binding protein FerR (iron transport regulator)|nr:DUF4974 domain-containing protein [Tannerella sp.]
MREQKDINDHIIGYFLQEQEEITDPVLIGWLDENESNSILFKQYKRIWDESKYYMEKEAFDTGKAWDKIHHIHQEKEKFRRRLKNFSYTISGVAATIFIILMLSFLGVLNGKPETLVSMATDYGNRSEITLPDGSVVRLNSGSDITYAYNPRKKVREVSFQGEGFFDISKSKEPFVIKLENDLEVTVLGTSFNLYAYAGDQIIQASLVEGCIELNHTGRTLQMNAGEMAVYDKETNQLKLSEGILSHAYGWLENKLYMNDMSLSDVCKHLERWYNVDISVQKELGENLRYNGVIKEESIVDVLDALSRLSHIDYHIKGKHIYITSK